MMDSDPLQILLAHDRWASGQVLGACEGLTPEQFQRRFDMGPGSLHDTLTHVVGAMRAWTETLAGLEPRPRLETDGVRRTPAEIRGLLEEACAAFGAEAGRRPLGEIVTRHLRDGRTRQLTRAAVFVQVTTHGMHHRAQCLNMLKQLGVTPLPPTGVAEWAWRGEGK